MLKCSSKSLVAFRPVGENGVPPGAQKHQNLHLLYFLTPSGVIFRCFGAQLRSGPAGRDGPSLRALLLLAARKSQAILHVLIGFISQHFRGAAAQRKLELLRSAFCARLLRRCSRSNIVVAAHVKAGTTLCGNQSSLFAFAACADRLLLLEAFISLSRVTQN